MSSGEPHAGTQRARSRVAVVGAAVAVGSGLVEALAPYESTIIPEASITEALDPDAVAVVIVASEPVPATAAVEAARSRRPEVPIVVVTPSLSGFDRAALSGAGATEVVSFADASARSLALVVEASCRVQALRLRVEAVERECRSRDAAFTEWVAAECKVRGALREGLAGMLAAVRALRHAPGLHASDPVVLDSMVASLQRMQALIDRRDREVVTPVAIPA